MQEIDFLELIVIYKIIDRPIIHLYENLPENPIILSDYEYNLISNHDLYDMEFVDQIVDSLITYIKTSFIVADIDLVKFTFMLSQKIYSVHKHDYSKNLNLKEKSLGQILIDELL